ncbi:MAG: hypothetical protein NTV10_04305 [Methanoregula sp.]|jgi:hypothetical protein|nr:hypothetical protein [Methanoregula sp.]
MPEDTRRTTKKHDVIIMADKPCCAAEALRRIRQIDVNDITTGISMLDESIDEVKGLGLSDERAIREALVKRVKIYNYIPPAAAEAYADAIVREYRHAERKNFQGSAGNDRRDKEHDGREQDGKN